MDNIIEPNKSFDFSKLSLGHPTGIQGGAYFTKVLFDSSPFYIQTPKSLTRQGFVKTGKKMYSDLMFDYNANDFINWLENLETKCQELILEKSDEWFQEPLDINDIESAFSPIIRVYKSGKYYLVRTNIKYSNTSNSHVIKIYNEDEQILSLEDIHANMNMNIISILEIQGIKFTSRNFQIEIENKQIMVLNKEPVFENCLIKKKDKCFKIETTIESNKVEPVSQSNIVDFSSVKILENILNSLDETKENEIIECEKQNIKSEADNFIENDIDIHSQKDVNLTSEILNNKKNFLDELEEIDLSIHLDNNNLETMKLRKPNEVYYEIYKEALKKAKKAKKQSLIAYLEAKKIKKTYMLTDIEVSDEESENSDISMSDNETQSLE